MDFILICLLGMTVVGLSYHLLEPLVVKLLRRRREKNKVISPYVDDYPWPL